MPEKKISIHRLRRFSQIKAMQVGSICENLRNLWINVSLFLVLLRALCVSAVNPLFFLASWRSLSSLFSERDLAVEALRRAAAEVVFAKVAVGARERRPAECLIQRVQGLQAALQPSGGEGVYHRRGQLRQPLLLAGRILGPREHLVGHHAHGLADDAELADRAA